MVRARGKGNVEFGFRCLGLAFLTRRVPLGPQQSLGMKGKLRSGPSITPYKLLQESSSTKGVPVLAHFSAPKSSEMIRAGLEL